MAMFNPLIIDPGWTQLRKNLMSVVNCLHALGAILSWLPSVFHTAISDFQDLGRHGDIYFWRFLAILQVVPSSDPCLNSQAGKLTWRLARKDQEGLHWSLRFHVPWPWNASISYTVYACIYIIYIIYIYAVHAQCILFPCIGHACIACLYDELQYISDLVHFTNLGGWVDAKLNCWATESITLKSTVLGQ